MKNTMLNLVVTVLAMFLPAMPLLAASPAFVWIEGETARSNTAEVKIGGWGRVGNLSASKWLHIHARKAEEISRLPAEGLVLNYTFEAQSGPREIWAHLGFESVRSPFEWRLDDGPWRKVDPFTSFTTDLKAVADWCEVAWLRLGDAELSAGEHTLAIRVPIETGETKGKASGRLLFGIDALCIVSGPWRPNGVFKPGDNAWRTEADEDAEKHVFQLNGDTPRITMSLDGLWQAARWDEGKVADRTGPTQALPDMDTLHWSSLHVPGDRLALKPNWDLCHRYLLRAKVNVPASMAGRSFVLDLAEVGTMVTVFVNGERLAFSDAVLCPLTVDVTDAIHPGKINEIALVIKDAYYAMKPDAAGPKNNVRHLFNIPRGKMKKQSATMRMDYPVARHGMNDGVLDHATLIATGEVYVDHVATNPSVKDKTLEAHITLKNSSATEQTVSVTASAVPLTGGKAEKTFQSKTVRIPAHGQVVVMLAEPWTNPKLWWPSDPQQYRLVTTVRAGARVLDAQDTVFGFRTWEIVGTRFVLNGVPWQLRANLDGNTVRSLQDAQEAVRRWKRIGMNCFRIRFQRNWGGMTRSEWLDFLDSNGMIVRDNVGTFDGQMCSYSLATGHGAEKKSNEALFANWHKQVRARTRRELNHPCVWAWELDNEVVFINARNLGNLDVTEPAFREAARIVNSIDPQKRGQLTGGGRALMDQSLPINGCHYEASSDRDYPDMAYGLGEWTAQSRSQPWPMAIDKPIFLSEAAFVTGRKPSALAGVGGEVCFAGRADAIPASSLLLRMYSEGYRWQALGGFHFWADSLDGSYWPVWQPVCALVREWNTTLSADKTIPRTVMVRNDTRFASPITMTWRFCVGGKVKGEGSKTLRVTTGQGEICRVSLETPPVRHRTPAEFSLTLERDNKKIWSETKVYSIINPNTDDKPALGKSDLVVWDTHGEVRSRLTDRGIPFVKVGSLEELPKDFKVLVIGPDTLPSQLSTDPRWKALAQKGKRVLLLDQAYPLHYQAVPADFGQTDFIGRVAFPEDPSHPVFEGLQQSDFFCFSGDHVVYRNPYRKATRGARSLLQCDDALGFSAIAECRVGEGLLLLSQVAIGGKLATDPVAQRLFDNLLNYAVDYFQQDKTVAAMLDPKGVKAKLLAETGMKYALSTDPMATIKGGKEEVVLMDATDANLKTLVAHLPAVQKFTTGGGWLILWGVTPAGLADFNRLVGVDHILRPFQMEKVTLATIRDPLSAGMTTRDVTLYSGRRIFGHLATEFVADDMFTYIVDLDDVAPFMTVQGGEAATPTRPGRIVNGFVSSDAWKLIHYISLDEETGGVPSQTYTLPREETVTGFSIVPNAHYQGIVAIKITPDGEDARSQTVRLAPFSKTNNLRQDFTLKPMKARSLTLTVPELRPVGGNKAITGIDNLWIRVARGEAWSKKVHPLLNIGGIVKYPQGDGGIVLNQLRVNQREAVPVNRGKKTTILRSILGNLGVSTKDVDSLEAEAFLEYEPVSLENVCNVFLMSEQGFPDKAHDLSHLPLDRQVFAAVPFEIRNFKTSPLESAVTVKGLRGVEAPKNVTIPVGRKADAVFFLHTMVQHIPWEARRGKTTPPVLWEYVVEYTDGKQAVIPVAYGLNVAHWVSAEPCGLKNAALAWAAPFANDPKNFAQVFQMRWTNLRPETAITSITIRRGKSGVYGSPILLGVTTARKAR